MRMWRIDLTAGLMLCGVAGLAMPQFLGVFKTTYKTQTPANSVLAKSYCVVCHEKASGGTLNAYGADVKKAMAGSTTVTAAVLAKVEALDSDKDGVKNIDEIKKGTLPGDAKSK